MLKKLLFIIILSIISISSSYSQYTNADDLYREGKKLLKAGNYEKAIPLLEKAVKLEPSAANYRLLAEAYEKAKKYPKAVEAYKKEASIYKKKGDINAATVEEQKANSLTVDFRIYYASQGEKISIKKLAKGEPLRGCLIGAYIEDDTRIYGKFEKFNKYTGKDHSSFYAYIKYGEPFPAAWCNEIKRLGAIPHIAWEPNDGLNRVKDDNYSRSFAKEAAKLDWPIFLRFASEMNGDWTAYTGNPKLYKEKFRLIHNIFEKNAPKVIMLWTPNSIPQSNITDYYPGDKYVDWVGINIYSVHHHGNDLSQSGEKEDPTYLLEYIYKIYSKKKPIHISEFASTHLCKACNREVINFGISKMEHMYYNLPLLFPGVKCIDWFDCNTIKETGYSVTSPNDYSLTDNLKILNTYRKIISSDYFISYLNSDGTYNIPDYTFSLLRKNITIYSKGLICSSVRSYLKTPEITYYIDGKKIKTARKIPYYLELDSNKLAEGTHTLKALLSGDNMGTVSSKEIKFSFKKGSMNITLREPTNLTHPVPPEKERSEFLWEEKW